MYQQVQGWNAVIQLVRGEIIPLCFESRIPLEDHGEGCGCSSEGAYVRTQSVRWHAIGIQSRTFYWNCIGQSEERYPDFHGQKPMCSGCGIGPLRSLWYGQSFKASESAAMSHRSRRDSTHVVWVVLERTHTGSSHPIFNSAIRWTATGSAARKRSRTHIVHDLHISPRRHRTPSWHQGALLCRWYAALCFVWHQGQSTPSSSSNGGMCQGHQYVDGRQSINQSINKLNNLFHTLTIKYNTFTGLMWERGKLKCNTYKTLSPFINYS